MTPTDSSLELQKFLHEKIPLSRAMGVQVVAVNDTELTLCAPLEPNHNHLGTAFGGSLSALATLAGYTFLWIALGDRDAHIVIRDSTISYQKPVRGELRATCLAPDPKKLAKFLKIFHQKGKSRIKLTVLIEENGETAVTLTGTYVALR
ncbi:thioesterase domain-containing protein [Luteolibacter pohnpeiensis]|uniref:Thioesterase domain-containing protein n=1 Tax=Luteolibacter pohnpeiensis TaxID=454153 RepID=A0A934VSZ1_9BACT|nr:thioesterase domain-containing protein [Luteolibacter pohnpeiensis]MBK1880942.1 thioesterase domain-containing protein [Luteolibacter pohnpeiensis]